jgi:hypothetical protein
MFISAERKARAMRGLPRFFDAALLLMAGVAAAACLLAQSVNSEESRSGDKASQREWIAKRVQAWEPRKEERRLDEIGWAKDIRDALRLASEHHRPIFFFSYSGTTDRPQAMALQRC